MTAAVGAPRSPAGLPVGAPAHRRRPALALWGTVMALGLGLVLEASAGQGRIVNPFLPVMVAGSLLYGLLGYLVSLRHAGHPVAAVLRAVGVVGAATVLAGGHANAALFGPLPDAGATASLWFSRWAWVPQLTLQTTGVLLAYPDGQLPSPRWRPAAWFAVAGGVALAVGSMTVPFTESVWQEVPVENPLALPPGAVTTAALEVAPAWFVAGTAVAVAALVVRFRRTPRAGRGRLALVVPLAVLVPPALAASFFASGGLVEMVVVTALAVTVAWSMLRHGVLDLDVVVNRALVSTLLVASLVGAYVAVVVLVAQAIGSRSSWVPGVVAAGVVAVSFGPLMHRLQEGVGRLLHGDRERPGVVAERLAVAGASADPSTVLGEAAEALRHALRVPWVAVEAGEHAGRAGEPRTAGRSVPLERGGEVLGTLTVGARYDGERPTDADERVLDVAARQLAGTAHALLLAQHLGRARGRLVTAREDERRRIRRDLHDGLGPALAGITLGLEGAEEIARRDPAEAVRLLAGLRAQAESAVLDVRRLVDGLRPPALDALGLVGALEQELDRLAAGDLAVTLRAPEGLPDLPAALEVAALRVALEAAHNAHRHARASRCEVELALEGDALVVLVTDDGTGMTPGTVPHVGLHSMRERAEELGGTLVVESAPGAGTRVRATLPLGAA